MQVVGINGSRKTMEIRWLTKTRTKRKLTMPIYISTDPSHVNPQLLQNLFTLCNHSSHRFPKLSHEGTLLEAVDINKLSIALSHSFLLVSVFCNSQDLVDADADDGDRLPPPLMGLGDFLQRRLMPLSLLSPSQRRLVGFGRAVSDCGLTASIHDVMVVPSLQRMGIGRMIVRRLVRMLTNRDIYDIAALCSASESDLLMDGLVPCNKYYTEEGFLEMLLGKPSLLPWLMIPISEMQCCTLKCTAGRDSILLGVKIRAAYES